VRISKSFFHRVDSLFTLSIGIFFLAFTLLRVITVQRTESTGRGIESGGEGMLFYIATFEVLAAVLIMKEIL
jgi:hypothetical protein